MGQHTQHGLDKEFLDLWWGKKVLWGLTRNDISLIILLTIIALAYFSLNWDKIVTFW